MNFSLTGFDKAIAAAILAAAGVLVTASQSGSLTQADYIGAVVTGLVAGLAVYFKSNASTVTPVLPPKP